MRLSERQFVDWLRRQAARQTGGLLRSRLRRGIGDDCAVIAWTRDQDLLVTTDLFLEGIHFRRQWQEPESVGHKALARGLSDIAAMGGTPRYVFLSLGIPRTLDERWWRAFLRGFLRLATAAEVILAGGDTGAAASGVIADVMVVGAVPRGRALLRSRARPGEELWVSGHLGSASLGLSALRTRKKDKLRDRRSALQSLFYPQPRLRVGRYLQERKLATAMIDLSDGLSLDLARLCAESSVGARLIEESIPRAAHTPIEYALHGGEDLELLFTVPPARARRMPPSIGGVRLTRIGHITAGRRLLLVRGNKTSSLPLRGFQHF